MCIKLHCSVRTQYEHAYNVAQPTKHAWERGSQPAGDRSKCKRVGHGGRMTNERLD